MKRLPSSPQQARSKSMSTPRIVLSLAALLVALALTACSTPERRIEKNPELFAALPPDVQANVRAGRIDLGYSSEAVALALGEPDRQYTRRSTGGKTTKVWSYTSEYTTTSRQRVDARVRVRDSDGRMRTQTDWVDVDVDQRHEYEKLRIEFEENRVSAIETLER